MAQWGGKASSFIPASAKTNFCKAAGIDAGQQKGYPSAYDFARSLVTTIDVPDHCVIQDISIWGTEQLKNIVPF